MNWFLETLSQFAGILYLAFAFCFVIALAKMSSDAHERSSPDQRHLT